MDETNIKFNIIDLEDNFSAKPPAPAVVKPTESNSKSET